jgi:hypothetical protein
MVVKRRGVRERVWQSPRSCAHKISFPLLIVNIQIPLHISVGVLNFGDWIPSVELRLGYGARRAMALRSWVQDQLYSEQSLRMAHVVCRLQPQSRFEQRFAYVMSRVLLIAIFDIIHLVIKQMQCTK